MSNDTKVYIITERCSTGTKNEREREREREERERRERERERRVINRNNGNMGL
jgi:hypothetical protein